MEVPNTLTYMVYRTVPVNFALESKGGRLSKKSRRAYCEDAFEDDSLKGYVTYKKLCYKLILNEHSSFWNLSSTQGWNEWKEKGT